MFGFLPLVLRMMEFFFLMEVCMLNVTRRTDKVSMSDIVDRKSGSSKEASSLCIKTHFQIILFNFLL